MNRPCSGQAFLGGFVGAALRSLLQGRVLGLCSRCPGPQARLSARPGAGAERRSPAEPGIPAALAKPGLASPAQRKASAGLTHPSSGQSRNAGVGGVSHTHGPSVPLAAGAGPLPTRSRGRVWDCRGVWPIITGGNSRVRNQPSHAAGMGANGQAWNETK